MTITIAPITRQMRTTVTITSIMSIETRSPHQAPGGLASKSRGFQATATASLNPVNYAAEIDLFQRKRRSLSFGKEEVGSATATKLE